jgi:hypothetical protein
MITLTTIVWEKNYKKVLDPGSFFMQYKGKKVLVVNNVTSEINYDGKILYVKDHAEEAKKFFKLDIDESTKGYYYTMAYFVMLLKIDGYILNVSDDCIAKFEADFIKNSVEELILNPKVLTTTLEWGEGVGKGEMVDESPNFYYSKGFSDQVFFADTETLRGLDYNIVDDWDYYGLAVYGSNAVHHGGNSFEKRLATYMKHNNLYRGIYKKYNYKHG